MFRMLLEGLADYAPCSDDAKTDLLNDHMHACFAACGLGRLAVAGDVVVVNVRGKRADASASMPAGVSAETSSFLVDTSAFELEGDGYDQLDDILAAYDRDGDGAFVWIIPDGFLASLSPVEKIWEGEGGGYFSHESICVLNTSARTTRCTLEVFSEEPTRPPFTHAFEVAPHQSSHYRLDKLKGDDGSPLIPKDCPVSYKITSLDTPVVVQGSRILTSGRGSEFGSFGTAMAWTPR
ncbi:MAG: sensory rhodopsin transducer [Candidatus Poribacteria bacterium]